jgi:hypothetical protein
LTPSSSFENGGRASKVVVPTAEEGAAVERLAEYESRIAENRMELEMVEAVL